MDRKELFNKLLVAEKYYGNTKYQSIVDEAKKYYDLEYGTWSKCESTLNKLPSLKQLLAILIEKLRKKSVYRTLKKIQEGCAENSYTTLKGLSSLLTHIVIEAEHGSKEYLILIPSILEKINKVTYNL